MSEATDDGGPAFPVTTDQYSYGFEKDMPANIAPGMTLRDYFAAKALHALITEPPWLEGGEALIGLVVADSFKGTAAERFAFGAYEFADAMLKARGAA